MDEMQPCPFCDNVCAATMKSNTMQGIPVWTVLCGICGAHGALKESRQEAIDSWNRAGNDCRKWRSLTKAAAGTKLKRDMEIVSKEVEAANDGE
jgi:transcription elongation factor Elf1